MGYRSDIHSIIYSTEPDKLDAFIAAAHMKGVYHTSLADVVYRTQIRSHYNTVYNALVLSVESYKWYDSFPEVQSWNSLMSLSQDESFGLMYEFVRIGEDYNDMEFDSSSGHENLLRVTRRIETDFEEIEERE